MAYNSYINSFATSGDFETYIESSAAKAPNVAYLKDTDKVIYTTILPNDYLVYGTTTGTTDFTSNGITFHVLDGILYVAASDVPQSLTSLNYCFNSTEGHKVTKIKKWAIDTTNVRDMNGMFRNCSGLTSLDVSSFITTNVTDMGYMFNACSNLTSLDLSSFNTSNVTNMNGMFQGCTNLTSLDVSSFNTSNVRNMSSMFSNCSNLTSLDLSNFNTTNVTTMEYMFAAFNGDLNLTSLDLSSFDTTNVTTVYYMFQGRTRLNKLYLSSSFFNSTTVTTYDFSSLSAWTDAASLEQFVKAAEASNGSGKTIQLSTQTKNALTQAQKNRITGAGFTIS